MKKPISASTLGRKGAPPSASLDLSKLDINWLLAERDRVVARADARNPPITRVIPIRRRVLLGGERHVADELRLEDVAEIQGWLEDAAPHPLASIPPAWADPEPETRRARLIEAWEASGEWPVRYGTERASVLLASTNGRAYFLALCLRRSNPDFGPIQASRLISLVTPLEWAALRRVAYGLTPREEIAEELAPSGQGGRTANWCLSFHRAINSQSGLTYESIKHLTISQWRNFCSEGTAVERSPEYSAQAKRVRKLMEPSSDGK
jgi:hypothetical protein